MTDLMEEAINALQHVPVDQRDEVTRVVMRFAGATVSAGPYVPDAIEAAELDEAAAAADRGELATDEQVRAIWAKHGF